jgi:hypothetical protein
MKQSTKVLLPIGLVMSIVIPITVKSLFTEGDLFQYDESSKIDYLQPYKIKPEALLEIPGSKTAETVIQSPVMSEVSKLEERGAVSFDRSDEAKKDEYESSSSRLPSITEMEMELKLQESKAEY